MLAYVFWHWPQSSINPNAYIDHLIDFHNTLAANKPTGFHESVVFRIRGANWLNTNDEAYEEWYLLDDSAAMDSLNNAAVSGVCEEPHNKVAAKQRAVSVVCIGCALVRRNYRKLDLCCG
jgi:hypothetical protein